MKKKLRKKNKCNVSAGYKGPLGKDERGGGGLGCHRNLLSQYKLYNKDEVVNILSQCLPFPQALLCFHRRLNVKKYEGFLETF